MAKRASWSILITLMAWFICTLALAPLSVKAQKRLTVVVFDLEGKNVGEGVAEILTDNLREALFKTGRYKLVDRKQLEAVLKEHKFGQSGIASPEQYAELGKALQAQKIIYGSIGRIGTIYQVSLTLLDIETITIDNTITEKCFQCAEEQLFSLVSTAAMKLIGGSAPQPQPQPQPYPQPQPQPQPYPQPQPQPGKTAQDYYDQASDEDDINRRVQLYLQALQLDPNFASAHNDLGVDYTDLDRWEEAVREFQAALRINPDYTYAHNNLGYAYMNLGSPRLDDAINEFKAALRLDVNYDTAHHNLGKAYFAQGRYSDALYEFQQTANVNPEHASAQFNMARTLKRLNRNDDAIKAYLKCVEIDPDYIDAYYNLGDLYADMGKNKAAIYYFQKYIDKETRPGEQEWVEKARQRIRELR